MKASERDMRRLVAPALKAGYTLTLGKSGHWHLRRPDGTLAASLHSTPSDWRAVKNLRRDLRAAGVPL